MRRNVVAAALQVAGLLIVVAAGFTVSVALGVLCVGAVLVLVGLAFEVDA